MISAHPTGSCKEQTAGNVYAVELARQGFVAIAFDASFQGASGGEPRFTEDPAFRVRDFSYVIDYLVTQPYVDENRIGVLGICGGGGYAINATMTERRIKALGAVTPGNVGRLMREGFVNYDPLGALEAIAAQRTAEVRDQVRVTGRRSGGGIDVHPVSHRPGSRNGDDVEAGGDRGRAVEAHGFVAGHGCGSPDVRSSGHWWCFGGITSAGKCDSVVVFGRARSASPAVGRTSPAAPARAPRWDNGQAVRRSTADSAPQHGSPR
ncbi:Alpha/beta hydrolase family protein [Actinopolyspora xinjiangensis]|uniref:Alpha/beta hydrolase family protein n=1 Tax=Actinopolyspora xinjiangensis TaxID=405564 RepID=A0A1H0RFM8_9ACTN|nr:alpha/beta hydrolase [Actinopolyspora xinjiangensis]SDP27708.1 Alpha/beta hydrolase family protein [Actinopolyspora xinjiangensis]